MGEHLPARCTLLGIGAMASPRYAPAGLLVEGAGCRAMLDGGPGASPVGPLDAWLVCDDSSELRAPIRHLAADLGVVASVGPLARSGLSLEPRPVVHTSHPTFGYLVTDGSYRIVWAPEFLEFPAWAAGADLVFAEASGWDRPIRFARGAGGHMAALAVAAAARSAGVRRLVFAHLGRPTLRALDRGERPPFGEIGIQGATYEVGGNEHERTATRNPSRGPPTRGNQRVTRASPRSSAASPRPPSAGSDGRCRP